MLMKLLSQYLERALHFERLASEETEPKLKASLEEQAASYRRMAAKHAKMLGLRAPNAPDSKQS
jgi:hypothetical protein